MNHEDKANELVHKFMPYTDMAGDAAFGYEAREINKKQAKQCALICVDEIMEAGDNPINGMPDKIISGETLIGGKEFWQKVKEKIQSL